MKKIRSILLATAMAVIIAAGISVFTEGVPLMGLPKEDEIVKVSLQHEEVPEPKYFTDSENIELAFSILRYLNYAPLKEAESENEPTLTITYYLKDGTKKEVSANKTTVFYEGKAHTLKREGTFLKMAEGIFFFEEFAPKY